ncbi:SDR family NAD(P)-dependent oxidoreductase [Chryseobacterium oryzae]|uniref:SDR family NAD(P)-dependent oxidoreductase n=1 Tax=Chryseobacterium oryzae TaxID=2929799 RepID=A0ABY4BEF7_9FLAO|nr:SDR family NAD(P)-dependent oxidoreductase [Chryseobacterium oryzae]UOE37552.1 SDR family NAD(P)-dependent oxidoreductase [Chryseobacterium oryzae]
MSDKKVWFITGASSGFGLAAVKTLLKHGFRVAATSRDEAKLASEVNDQSGNFFPISMQITDQNSVDEAVTKVKNHFGRIDVTINNAGYILVGAIEELTDDEIKANYDVNVFGTMRVIRSVMKVYREQNSGYFLNMASISGSITSPAQGIYSSTKAAVILLTEAVDEEGREFGVRATAVCPGGFKTNFLGGSAKFPQNPMNNYRAVRQAEQSFRQLNQNQGGDPVKAAEAFIKLAESNNPPQRIYLGTDGFRAAEYKIREVATELEQWQQLSLSTNYR